MAGEAPTVGDIFRRAQAMRRERPNLSYKDLRQLIMSEFEGKAFPPIDRLAIPEQDNRAPEEDWSAGLSLISRGIQMQSWKGIADGIVLCLEQTEGFERQSGRMGSKDEWHDRSVGIREPLSKGVNKWMPDELKRLVEQQAKKE